MVGPTEIYELVQKHLGQKALDTQAQYGRGAWKVINLNIGEASFVPTDKLEALYGSSNKSHFDGLIEEVTTFDPLRQVIIVFDLQDNLHMIAIIDIE